MAAVLNALLHPLSDLRAITRGMRRSLTALQPEYSRFDYDALGWTYVEPVRLIVGEGIEVCVCHLKDVDLHIAEGRADERPRRPARCRAGRHQQFELRFLMDGVPIDRIEVGRHSVRSGQPAHDRESTDERHRTPGLLLPGTAMTSGSQTSNRNTIRR